ncbi:MAG TPA: ATP-binding protein [Rudaea sp.]|jgi:NtrC-family two-component system sensor histidine kinase KinB
MNLRTRLALSHGIIIALTLLVTPLALYSVSRFAGQVDVIADQNVRAIEATENIRKELGIEIGNLLRAMAGAQTVVSSRDGEPPPLHGAVEAARPYFTSPVEREALLTFERKYSQFNADLVNRSFDTDGLPSHFAELVVAVSRMRALKTEALANAAQSAREFAWSMFVLLIAIAVAALAVGVLAMFRSIRTTTAPVDQLNDLIQRMRGGDFDIEFKAGPISDFNALGRHFDSMAQALRIFRATNIERVLAEQRRSEAVLDSIGDGLVIFSDRGEVERINPVAERQLGIDHGSAIGKSFEQVGDHRAGAQVREVLDRGELSGSAQPEMHVERDGEKRVFAYSLHRFEEGDGGRPGVVMVLRDVTVQREFDKMRSEFVLRASHELRTPIASIRMGIGLLFEKLKFAPGSRDEELYETVQQEVQRMVHLLTDLLDLSRLRIGEQIMERTSVNVAAMVADAGQRFAPAATSGEITLEVDLEPGLPRRELCRSALDRVLDNLINNALRHTAPGGTIRLRALRSGAHVQIAVDDTGEGIPANQLALVFQPFVQIGTGRSGAGLGLAICKEIVTQLGGEISVASHLRRGTTFTISFPG